MEENKNYIASEFYSSDSDIKEGFFGKVTRGFFESIQTLVISLGLFVLIYTVVFSPAQVLGTSMLPNLKENEIMLTEKFSGRFSEYKRGDIVVIKFSDNKDIVKRVIGLPNENIKLSSGKVYINGKKLEEPYLASDINTNATNDAFLTENQEVKIPSDSYFVMGDNREVSYDSRAIGFISPSKYEIRGKVILIYWPIDQAKIEKDITYNI